MEIISGTTDFHSEVGTALAIGKFDGLHLGHRKLLSEIAAQKKRGWKSTIFTFDPLPEVFFGMQLSQELSTRQEKRRLFEEIGIDLLVEFPFNKETAATPPERFVSEILCGKLNARYIAAGPDLSFGNRGRGNFELLRSMEKEYHYETKMIEKVELGGRIISSTLIRRLVGEGRMEEAAACLGSPYHIQGTIVHGRALGRRIGIPTLNQIPQNDKLLPPFGVYYSIVEVDGRQYRGMTNIGMKPTVSDEHKPTVETYLYDFSGDLYGEVATVYLLTYRRPERKFSGIEELSSTMQADIAAGKIYHAAKNDIKLSLHEA